MAKKDRTTQPPQDAGRRRLRRRIALAVILCLVGIGGWLIVTLPQSALSQVERLTNTQWTCTSLKVRGGCSVTLEDLIVRPRKQALYDNAILRARRVQARFSVWSLLRLRPQIKELTIEDFVLQAQLDLDSGRWNLGEVKVSIPKGRGGGMPDIHLIGGTLKYTRLTGGREEGVEAIPIDASLALSRRTPNGYEFEVTAREVEPAMGSTVLRGFWSPGRVAFTGGIRSKAMPSQQRAFGVEAMAVDMAYDANDDYRLQVRILDLFSARSPQEDAFALIQPLFFGESNPVTRVQKFFSRFGPSGKANVHLQAQGNFRQILKSHFQGTIDCKDVAIRDRRFAYPLEHVSGTVEFTEDSFRTDRLAGQHGDVTVLIDFWTKGGSSNWQYDVGVSSTRMRLDQDLFAAMGESQKKWWSALDPNGTIAVQYRASGQSSNEEKSSLLVKPLGVTAAYEAFPYPLSNVTGELLFTEDRIILSNLVSQAEGGPRILLDGTLSQLDSKTPKVELTIQAYNVPLDESLAHALGPSRRSLYDPLQMTGRADATIKVFSDANETASGGIGFDANVVLADASLKVCNGSVRLDHANGHAEITPTSVSVKDLACRYGQTAVQLRGDVSVRSAADCGYHWFVQAQQIPLEDLLAALPMAAQEAVDTVHPTGAVDVTADLDKSDPAADLKYEVHVNCLEDRVLPRGFPYPLREVTGRVMVTNDKIVLDDVTAKPDTPASASVAGLVRTAGQLDVSGQKIKTGRLSLTAENIGLDDAMMRALPQRLGSQFNAMAPSGQFSLLGGDIQMATQEDTSLETRFSGRVRLDDCALTLLGTQASGKATLEVNGVHRTESGLTAGCIRVGADRVTLRGKSATDLSAVFRYDPAAHSWSTDDKLSGRFYGGQLGGRLEFCREPTEDLRCQVELAFADADLAAFLADRPTPAREPHSSGVLNGRLSLVTSSSTGMANQIGECHIKVRDMQIGRASPLSKVLAVLRMSEPSDYIFESMELDAYIRGEKLLIGHFDVSGASAAFQGTGTLDLGKNDLNLTLLARSRRRLARAEPTALQSLTEGLGGAVVRMEITGSPDDPNVTTRPLPVLEEPFRLLGTTP